MKKKCCYEEDDNHSAVYWLPPYIIEYDLITVDSIKADHNHLKGEIHSLYEESIYAHASDKLSYDVIGLISLIDRVKNAALRLIRNDVGMAETARVNSIIASNAKQRLSDNCGWV